jgi:hypothetical protein
MKETRAGIIQCFGRESMEHFMENDNDGENKMRSEFFKPFQTAKNYLELQISQHLSEKEGHYLKIYQNIR